MTVEDETTGLVEIRLTTTGVRWLAGIEAQGADHLRLCIRPDELGVLPLLGPGTAVECAMNASEGRYYIAATVIDQCRERIWLYLPPIWRRTERRGAARTSGGFAVKYSAGASTGMGACLDVSAGGIRLRTNVDLSLRSEVDLLFVLPGEALPVQTRGIVLYVRPGENDAGAFDIGIKFVHLDIGDGARIARYCRDLAPAAPAAREACAA